MKAAQRTTLFLELLKRDLAMKYRGSVLGVLWSFFTPLLLLALYYVVFGLVFEARGFGHIDNPALFACTLFLGISLHQMFSECVVRAPTLMSSNVNLIKKVVFPLRLLAPVVVVAALIQFIMSLCILMVALALLGHAISWTIFLIPILLFPFMLLLLGMVWGLSALGVYLPDIRHTIGMFVTACLLLSPVFYSLENVPENVRAYFYLNPLTFIVEEVRHVMLDGALPDMTHLAIYTLASVLVMGLGHGIFARTRRGFADVL